MHRKLTAEEIAEMTADEKLHLIEELKESLNRDGAEPPPNEEELALIRERLESFSRNPQNTIPWEEVKRRALGR